jgi:hypothetical protein
MKRSQLALAAGSAVAIAALLAVPAISQPRPAGPIARYTVDAATVSGIMAMAGNGRGGLGAAMAVMRGGAGQVAHELTLKLGSTRQPTGAPTADHFMPPPAGLGASVPLLTPVRTAPTPVPTETPGMPQGQMPRGRLLLFWGCGEHAPAGQPVVIDFSKMARGQIPPGLYAAPLNLPDDWTITPANSTTYGEWPNSRDTKRVPQNGSLLGAHRVASTYAPEINFSLVDDFMPALQASGRDLPSGAQMLSWNSLPKATGYYAWSIGAAGGGARGGETTDLVWWTSSATQAFGGPMSDWLSPAAVARLVAARTVMPPAQTTCAIPAEVKTAAGPAMMTQLFAYGPQVDFAYPPRPAAPAAARAAWRPEWIARVRFRASTALLPGLSGMSGADSDRRGAQSAPQQQAKPRCRGLAGIAQRAAGLCE